MEITKALVGVTDTTNHEGGEKEGRGFIWPIEENTSSVVSTPSSETWYWKKEKENGEHNECGREGEGCGGSMGHGKPSMPYRSLAKELLNSPSASEVQ